MRMEPNISSDNTLLFVQNCAPVSVSSYLVICLTFFLFVPCKNVFYLFHSIHFKTELDA